MLEAYFLSCCLLCRTTNPPTTHASTPLQIAAPEILFGVRLRYFTCGNPPAGALSCFGTLKSGFAIEAFPLKKKYKTTESIAKIFGDKWTKYFYLSYL